MGFLARWSLRSKEKITPKKKQKRTEGKGLHRVRGADGLPEDGVGPADLLAEPPKRVPNRHPRDAERERTLTTLAPREAAAAASSAPLNRTDERDRRLPRRRGSWRARPASRGARRPSSSSRFPSPPARTRPSGGRPHSRPPSRRGSQRQRHGRAASLHGVR